MKRLLSFCGVAALALSFAACNSSDTATDNKDSANNSTTNNASSDMNNASSVGNYAALADSVRINSEAGYYLNPRTGKPYKNLKVDSSGQIWDETGMPVWRYVDNRNWWVYGDWDQNMSWEQEAEAKMQEDRIMYKEDGDAWVDYDAKWKMKDEEMEKKWKSKDGDIKIKTKKDGDTKIKVGDEKIKLDKDGIKKDN
jgi:hypothetical protein